MSGWQEGAGQHHTGLVVSCWWLGSSCLAHGLVAPMLMGRCSHEPIWAQLTRPSGETAKDIGKQPIAKVNISTSGPSKIWFFYQRAWALMTVMSKTGWNSNFEELSWLTELWIWPLGLGDSFSGPEPSQNEPSQSVPHTVVGMWTKWLNWLQYL